MDLACVLRHFGVTVADKGLCVQLAICLFGVVTADKRFLCMCVVFLDVMIAERW